MSLKPLDLQTLFVRMNQVSKQQAARQEAPLHAQQVAAQEIEQETQKADTRVSKTDQTSPGPEKLHDEQNGSAPGNKGDNKKHDENGQDEDNSADNPFRDPALGNRIDISG